ncbi:hypothetical protein GCM10008959_31910 [Deinococcus seoulensis]|uniref:DUF4365 domain-containing protein n=2 Tax=Deinococcus seoulensis TaxID=1837379 RepID=A0ABQ2RUJ4_9DEIO|nr:hypothetical protein GCM10008959_31910 [Deinococcus seoulensis]
MIALSDFFTGLGWAFESVTQDYGLDAKIETFTDEFADAFVFFVQSKSSHNEPAAQPVKYFEDATANYYANLNVPVLVTKYTVTSNRLLYAWILGLQSFERTQTRHKLTFDDHDLLNDRTQGEFKRSARAIQNIVQSRASGILAIRVEGNVRACIDAQAVVERLEHTFSGRVGLDDDSPIIVRVDEDAVTLDIPGVRRLSVPLTRGFEAAFVEMLVGLHTLTQITAASYSLALYALFLQDEYADQADFRRIDALFRPEFDFGPVLAILEDQALDSPAAFNLMAIAQLRWFNLRAPARETLSQLRRRAFEDAPGEFTRFNLLMLSQASGDHDQVREILESFQLNDPNLTFVGRTLTELGHAALRAGHPDICITALTRPEAPHDAEAEYLLCWARIRQGQYRQARMHASNLQTLTPKPPEVMLLETYLSLLVDVLGLMEQDLSTLPPHSEHLDLPSYEAAAAYIFNIDATHPVAWYALGSYATPDTRPFNEPEFYYAFSAIMGHGRLTFRAAISAMLEKGFGSEADDQASIQVITYSLLEHAFVIHGPSYTRQVIKDILETGYSEEFARHLNKIVRQLIKSHSERDRLLPDSKPFITNSIFSPSVVFSAKSILFE